MRPSVHTPIEASVRMELKRTREHQRPNRHNALGIELRMQVQGERRLATDLQTRMERHCLALPCSLKHPRHRLLPQQAFPAVHVETPRIVTWRWSSELAWKSTVWLFHARSSTHGTDCFLGGLAHALGPHLAPAAALGVLADGGAILLALLPQADVTGAVGHEHAALAAPQA